MAEDDLKRQLADQDRQIQALTIHVEVLQNRMRNSWAPNAYSTRIATDDEFEDDEDDC